MYTEVMIRIRNASAIAAPCPVLDQPALRGPKVRKDRRVRGDHRAHRDLPVPRAPEGRRDHRA